MFARCGHNCCFRDSFYTLSEYGNKVINTEANSEYFRTVPADCRSFMIAVRFFITARQGLKYKNVYFPTQRNTLFW